MIVTKFFIKFFIYVFSILLAISTSIHFAFTYDYNDFEKVQNGSTVLPYAYLCCAPLWGDNFNEAYFPYSSFNCASFEGSCLIKAVLDYSDFDSTIFIDANLTEASFRGSIFLNAYLQRAKVKGANFYGVLGLTNAQKKYLRENGAINVPKDLNEKEFEQELKIINEMRKDWLTETIKSLFSRLFCCCTKSKKK